MPLFRRDPSDPDVADVPVVIIDDEPEMRTVLRSLLERDGFEVVADAGDGAAGIAAVVEFRPQLLISDLVMPGLDGLDVTRAVRESDPQLPIVLLTAFADADVVERASAVGVTAVVDKRGGLADIMPVLQDVLSPGGPSRQMSTP